ncbi:uncharacterized protein H6S33_008516 [Morchella sextelata]|uniref:uncharacterized protein n=1 Tax=Morchella sextelata TaxID=1174677 RepID=UPI001D04C7CC|nr:uncharacterized protein H6S33_008516 [Morchella sextelata]KAH0602866.1 hypothetical protein H6S33_008516 [Morchella sextelata]
MESLARGRTSQFHSLHTRQRQIAHARHTLRRARLTHRQRLLTLSTIKPPTQPFSSTHPAAAAAYKTAIKRLKSTLKQEYKQARSQHLRAIHLWEREVGELLVFLSGPGYGRMGWVWEGEEPEEGAVGDGEYVPPPVEEEEEEEEEEDDDDDEEIEMGGGGGG